MAREGWETLDLMEEKPAPLAVSFTEELEHDGKMYRTGGVFLDILGMKRVPYVAMLVQEPNKQPEKLMEIDDAAHRFLVHHGLPEDKALKLVADAASRRGN